MSKPKTKMEIQHDLDELAKENRLLKATVERLKGKLADKGSVSSPVLSLLRESAQFLAHPVNCRSLLGGSPPCDCGLAPIQEQIDSVLK